MDLRYIKCSGSINFGELNFSEEPGMEIEGTLHCENVIWADPSIKSTTVKPVEDSDKFDLLVAGDINLYGNITWD